jgi:hypothetical protein
MMILGIIGFVTGAVLGGRFKVLILIPAISLWLLATAGVGLVTAGDIWTVLLAMLLGTASLQIGYLTGTFICFIIATGRAARIGRALRQPAARQPDRIATSAF